MKRFLLALAFCALATPALGQGVTLLHDENDVPVQSFFRLGSPHSVVILGSVSHEIDALNSFTRAVLVTCTVACNVAQKASRAVAFSTDFLLPAGVILQLQVRNGDSIAFVGTTGTAFVVELK